MPTQLDPALRRALADRVRYYNDLGIYDFYRRAVTTEVSKQASNSAVLVAVLEEEDLPKLKTKSKVADPASVLRLILEHITDYSPCRRHTHVPKHHVSS